jgi:hypothetical protein
MVTHEFARVQNRAIQHLFEWYNYKRETNQTTGGETWTFEDTKKTAKILKIAGTDLWWDDSTTIPAFSTLVLAPPIF